MSSFRVGGGKPLGGEITPQGAKNEAVQVICATLLTAEPVTISNLPDITDVSVMIDLARMLGSHVTQVGEGVYRFEAAHIRTDMLRSEAYTRQALRVRSSIMLLGPLLGRCGKASTPKPGGDRIGRRRTDVHFAGFQQLGAHFDYDRDHRLYCVEQGGDGLRGADLTLDEASITGTANIVMAATLARGITTLYNAACEPYIQQLCLMLNRMGARISGIRSNLLTIEGVETLGGTSHTLLPDMIEVGSFIGLAAITQSAITIKNCRIDMLGVIPDAFRKLGVNMEYRGDDIHVPRQSRYTIQSPIDGGIPTLADAPWPGLTPDLLSVLLVVATQADGSTLIHQKMFESRLFFVDKLIDMGAQIILCDPHRATVIGMDRRKPLRGVSMSSPDIRAGIALLIAALAAQGESVISNIEQIERGYQRIEQRLRSLGADIERVE